MRKCRYAGIAEVGRQLLDRDVGLGRQFFDCSRDTGALASAIGGYLGDPEAARAAGEAGARWAREQLSPAALSARLFTALRDVASARGSGPRAA